MATAYRLVLVTVSAKREGLKIAQGLLDLRLAACVNFLPKIESYYRWKGKIRKSEEILLLIKTRTTLMDIVIQYIKEHHSYEVFETISLPIMEGNRTYLDWIGACTNFVKPIKDLAKKELEQGIR